MKHKICTNTALTAVKSDVLLVGCFEGELAANAAVGNADTTILALAAATNSAVVRQAEVEKFNGAVGEVLVHFNDGAAAPRVIVFGLGARGKSTLASFRKSLTAALKRARALQAEHVAFANIDYAAVVGSAGDVSGNTNAHTVGRTIASYAGMVDYVINHQKTAKGGHKAEKRFKKLHLIADLTVVDELGRGLSDGFKVAAAVNYARDLSNEPAGTLTPAKLVAEAKKAASASKRESKSTLSLTVHNEKALRKMGANALLAVAAGSSQPPYLIDLVYTPAGMEKDPVALTIVGKSVTFDSGGLDIKPADGMRHMKRDMSGGAVTLAAIQAIAAMGLPIKVRCVMAATENMINGKAYKPGDVIHTMNGLSVEVDNTDAEGRLTLADAIEYAKRLGDTTIVDLATLTGAVKMVTGDVGACVFSNNDEFSSLLVSSAASQGERLLNIPMWEEFRDANKSDMADLKNSGGAPGSTTAAYFLRSFAGEEIRWAHLDIAGVAFRDRELGADPRGSTGFGVRTLVELATRLAAK
jgi:leucyl aminopeptidase